jgi:4a-hydroxytetrahydrobiopterin dehydratase
MSEKRITGQAFHDAEGVDDWRVLAWGAHAYFSTKSFAEGASFVAAIAEAAEAMGHFPDIDLRPEGVVVRTFSSENGALGERDIELARQVSEAAKGLGLVSDPSQASGWYRRRPRRRSRCPSVLGRRPRL